MKTIRLLVDLTYDDEILFDPEDSKQERWFLRDVLGDPDLILHSNEIGDEVGRVVVRAIFPEKGAPFLLSVPKGKTPKEASGAYLSISLRDLKKLMEED